jgi:hypothetical protein
MTVRFREELHSPGRAVAVPRPGPKGKTSDAELIALAVAQAAMGIPSDRQFLGLVGSPLEVPCSNPGVAM